MNLPCFLDRRTGDVVRARRWTVWWRAVGSTRRTRARPTLSGRGCVDGAVACAWVCARAWERGVGAAAALGHVVLGRQPEREDEELEEEDVGEVQDELDGHRVARVVDYTRGATRLNYTVLLRVLDCGEERRARRARVRARAAVYSQWGSWAAGQRSLSTGMDRPLLGSSPPPSPDLPKKALEGLRLRTG